MSSDILIQLINTIEARKNADANTSYVANLFGKGRHKIAQKLGEEAVELVIAATADDKVQMVSESADLLFHWLVLLADAGIAVGDILAELERREGLSGLDEKASREG